MKIYRGITVIILNLVLIFGASARTSAQSGVKPEVFDKIEMLSPDGDKIRELDVRLHLKDERLEIESVKTREIVKTMNYAEIRSAEYSYTKNPRWKTALGLGTTAVIFPAILLVAIPLGFTKHRRHWLTVRTDSDYAVLKLSKGTRKVFMPSFETHSGVRISALGDDK